MDMLRVLVVWVCLAMTATPADARELQSGWFGGVEGTVPPEGTLYFAYKGGHISELVVSPRNGVRVTRVSRSVLRLDYDLAVGDTIRITDRTDGVVGRVRIAAPTPTPTPTTRPRVQSYEHHQMTWGCSTDDVFTIRLDQPVAAVRVQWISTGGTLRRSIAVPLEFARVGYHAFDLGGGGVAVTNIPPHELHAGGLLTLSAIRLDGTEVPIEGAPRFLSAPGPSLYEGADDAWDERPARMPTFTSRGTDSRDTPSWVLVGAALVISVFVLLRLRARAPAQPLLPPL